MAKEKSEVKEEVVKVAKSKARIAFEKLLEVYKVQNPTKYEAKKEELEKKLNSL